MGTESCRSQGKSNERKERGLDVRYIGDDGAFRFRVFQRAAAVEAIDLRSTWRPSEGDMQRFAVRRVLDGTGE